MQDRFGIMVIFIFNSCRWVGVLFGIGEGDGYQLDDMIR